MRTHLQHHQAFPDWDLTRNLWHLAGLWLWPWGWQRVDGLHQTGTGEDRLALLTGIPTGTCDTWQQCLEIWHWHRQVSPDRDWGRQPSIIRPLSWIPTGTCDLWQCRVGTLRLTQGRCVASPDRNWGRQPMVGQAGEALWVAYMLQDKQACVVTMAWFIPSKQPSIVADSLKYMLQYQKHWVVDDGFISSTQMALALSRTT